MADLERLSRALKAAHAAGDTAAATKLAQAIKAARAQPTINNQVQKPEPVNQAPEQTTGDTSMGTAFQVGDAQAQSLAQSGTASLQRNLSGGIFGDAQRYLTENIANPVREFVGADPIDIDAVNQAETKRLEKAAELSAEAAQKLQDDLNFKNLTTGDIKDIGSFVNFVSQKTAQALPYMGAALASGGTLTYPFGVGEISQSLDEIEGLDQAQKDDIAAAGGAIMAVLENLGIAKLLPNGISTSVIGGISKGFITEGTTEGLQELVVIGSEAVAGKKFTEEEIINRLKESVAAGGVVGSSIKATSNTATKVKSLFTSEGNLVDPDSIDADQKQAAASVAKIIRQVANQNGYNLSDVNASSSKGAKQALEATHENISEQIKQIAGNKVIKDLLSPKKASTLDQLIDDYTAAQVALRQGKNKVKSKVTEENYAAIMRLLPDSAEKTQIANLLKMSNQVTDLFNNGLKGGISQYTDYFNPLATSGGVYDPTRIANIILGAGGAFQSGGSTLGIAAGGRLVDAVTGRRSAVNRFTQQNENRPGLDAPSGTSLIQSQADAEAAARLQAEQEAADAETARFNRRQMNLELTQRDAAPTPDSPQAIMEDATGLDRSGVARVLRVIEATADNPAILDAIASYRKSVAEGGKVKDLSPLIRLVNERVNNNPGLVERVREPNNSVQPNVGPTSPQQPQGGDEFGPQFTTPQNYNRGIENNLQFNRELQDGAALDQSLSRVDRGRIITSLENLTNNLGSSPVPTVQTEIQKLQDAGVSQEAIDTYVQPYVDRVISQQKRNAPEQPAEPKASKGPDLPPIQGPVLNQTPNPLNIPIEDLSATNLNEMPSAEDIAQMRDGTYNPETKRTLVEAVDYLNNKWQKATGRTEPFKYTPENVDRIASLMATEAMQALKNDGNAIGWYDRKLKAAKAVVALVEPRVTQSPDAEAAFDFALAVTSNGQAVADNFEYALEVFRHFMDNGVMPTDTWIKGGERNNGMVQAFNFFNAYSASGANMPIQDFLDSDFSVRDLKEWAASFNAANGTDIKVPSSEGQNEMVKGSFVIGPKIGQGFYQNIRGNYDPLTMDIWWMRMWNRLVGRPFEASKDLDKNRVTIREQVKPKNQDALEKRLTNQTLKELGIKRSDLKNDETLDTFVTKLESNYQSFFRRRSKELKGTGKKVEKPQLFKSSGTMTKNMVPQLQAQPKGPGERSYMRTVTKAAIEKLRQNGYMIDTADFQALMWYPEKQLFRKLGVAPGRGADNDYLDAAKMLAAKEGFTDDQINQALPPSDGDGAVNSQPNTPGQDGPGNPRASRVSPAQQPRVAAALAERIQGSDRRSPPRSAVPSQEEVKQAGQAIKAVLEIGKPGSRYEDGIRTLDDVRRLADVINVSLELFSKQTELDAAYGKVGGQGAVAGFFSRNETTQRGVAAVLDEGAVDVLGVTTSEFDAYITALHEVLHGLADQQYHPAILNKFGTRAEGITRPLQKVGKNPLTGRIEFAGHGSFE